MNATDINMAVDNLLQKLGCTFETLVPSFARYSIAQNSIALVVEIVIITICAMMAKRGFVKTKDDEWWDNGYGVSIFCIIFGITVGIIALICFCVTVSDLVGWMAAPDAATLKYLINAIGG